MNKSDEHKEYCVQVLLPLYQDAPRGRDKLYNRVKEIQDGLDAHVSKRDVEYFLKNLETHQLHLGRPRQKNILPVTANRPRERYEVDLVDLSNLSVSNRNIKWLLTCIDVYSKFAFVKPLTNKRTETVTRAFNEIYEQYPCQIVQSDNGPEFFGLDQIVDKHILTMPYHPQSNGQIERFNATIKRMIFLRMTEQGNREYINQLDQFVSTYNTTIHRTHGFKPVDVFFYRQRYRMKKNPGNIRVYSTTLAPGDKVRIRMEKIDPEWRKNIFKKKMYLPRWTRELYTIKTSSANRRRNRGEEREPTFTLVEFEKKRFVEQDLMKVDENRLIAGARRARFEEPPNNDEINNDDNNNDNNNVPPLPNQPLPNPPRRPRDVRARRNFDDFYYFD